MPLVSDGSRADSKPSAGDGHSAALAVEGAVPTLEGRTSGPLYSSSNDESRKPVEGQPATTEIVDADKGDQKEAIISILEDWAAWERTLEEEAEKTNVATTTTDEQPLVEVVATEPAASNIDENTSSQPHINGGEKRSTNCVVAEFVNESAPMAISGPTSRRMEVLSATYSAERSNQLLYASRRERRSAERRDPVARARRQALKVWAADQTRRRSSASEISVSESLRRQGAGSFKEWVTMNSRSSRRSSADITVDHNRKRAGGSSESTLVRRKILRPRVFAPREMSAQRNIRNIAELRNEPRRSSRLAVAEQQKQPATEGKAGQRLKSSHPWRTNMKNPQERGERAFGIAREGGAPTAPSTPKSPAAAALSSSSSSSSMVAGRGSPWARSPSRETAGGILVKHCFFYGSSGKANSPKAVAATTNPSFESKWMRQFREEVSSNPNWWLGSDRFVLRRVTPSHPGNLRGGGRGSNGRLARRTTKTLTTRGDGSRADRTTDLWQEVRSLLAAGRVGGATPASGSQPGREYGDDGVGNLPGRVDLLSFGDRLRYTPLSQGAWLVGRAAAAAAAAEQRQMSAGSLSEEGNITTAARKVDGFAAAGTDAEGKENGKKEASVDDAVSWQALADEKHALGRKGVEQSDASAKASMEENPRSNRQDLQGIHAATLAKLRGEIDPFTREELVLRAAEEARGALARERARSSSPRRASASMFRPSSQRMRRGAVPDLIDYDKVEATLSLIELATRAAGPDAGKQMLQALEGLDKMHQRVSEEKGNAEEDRGGLDGEQGSTSLQEARPTALADKSSERKGSGGVASVASATTGNVPTIGDEKHVPDAAAQDEASNTSPRRPSRKYSLAVSSSSEESAAGSEASSAGIMQTIGNWLWSNTSPTVSRRNSHSSDIQAANGVEIGHESGLNEFPSRLEESDASELLETTDGGADNMVSEDKQGDQDATAERRANRMGSSKHCGGETEKPSQLSDSAASSSRAEGSASDNTPSEQRGYESQAEERASDVANVLVGGNETTSSKQASRGLAPDRSPRVKTRRSSEADKPSGIPQLAKEIVRAEESISHSVDFPREDTRESNAGEHSSRSEAPASADSTGGKEPRSSEGKASRSSESEVVIATVSMNKDATTASADVESSNAGKERTSTGKRDFVYDTRAEDYTGLHTPHSPSQASFEAEQGGGPAHEYRVHTEAEPSEEVGIRGAALGTTELCSPGKAEELGQRVAATANGEAVTGVRDTRDEDLGTGSPAFPLVHRDSWFSVGTRPRRGNNAVENQTPATEPSAAGAQRPGGRGEMSNQATTGVVNAGRDPLADRRRETNHHKGSPGGRWVPPKVSDKFVWPRPGQVGSPKRLRPPGPRGKDNTTPPLPRAPGIVRRSPLIDALHPEVARQREFQLQLRQSRQREAPSSSTKPDNEDFQDAAECLPEAAATNSRGVENVANRAAAALATTGATPTNASSGSKGTRARTRHAATAATSTATATGHVHVPTATDGGLKARHPRRPRWSEAAPLPVPPSPARKPSRPLLFPTGTGAGAGVGTGGSGVTSCVFADGADAVAREGRLSALQWEMVEAWMARARRSLGPKAWDCLGLSSAFHRTRNQIRQYLVLGDDENQSPVSHGGRSPPADAGSPQRSWMMDSEKVAPDRGRRAKDGQMGRANSRLNQARKRGTLKGGRTEEKGEAKEQGGKVGEVVSSGWDRHLCEKASLAINAVMWTIATERERSTYCTIFAAEEGDIATTTDGGGREALPTGNATAQQQAAWGTDNVCAGRATTEDSNPATTAELELRVSLAAARRFIKSSRLIDGVFVLDADVDLAFKRWEEVGRLAGRDQQRSRSTETTTCRSPIRRGVKGKGTAEPSFTDVNASVPPNQKLCEAVGCSDPALYGDVHPLAKAILCRKHRRNGMVDVGSRRCERPGCGRLAVGTKTNTSVTGGALCTLHAREGRVEVDGFADVLLELSKARHTRIRRAGTSAPASASPEEQGSLAARDPAALSLSLNVGAVRNVLLAITNQPLVPGLPSVGRQLSPAVVQGSAGSAPSDSAAFGHGNGSSFHIAATPTPTPTTTTTTTSAGPFQRRPVSGRQATPEPAVSNMTAASEQQWRRGSHGGMSGGSRCDAEDSEVGIGSGVLEAVGRVYRRSSAAVTSAVLGAPPGLAESAGEHGHGDLRSHQQEKRWSFLSRRESRRIEEEGRGSRGEQRVGLVEGTSACAGEAEVFDCRAHSKTRLQHGLHGGDGGGGGGDADDGGRDLRNGQQCCAQGPLQSRNLKDTTQSTWAASGPRSGRDETRRRGVHEVLAENTASLQAMFRKFSRQSAKCTRGASMTLSDILRFCDAFELRPGLVSTREIIDAYKEVAYPGVMGLTDEEVGFCGTKQKSYHPNSSRKSTSGRPVVPEQLSRQATSSSASAYRLGDPGSDPASIEGKGDGEPLTPEGASFGNSELPHDAASRDMTLEDLAKTTDVNELADRQGADQIESSRESAEGGARTKPRAEQGQGDEPQELADDDTRRDSGGTRGIGQKENSTRWAWNRRGTEECSLYFRSDSGSESHRVPSPSRRTSTASHNDTGGKGKRTVYLGRTQAFPLRRVESSLAVDARGFGLSGVSAEATGGNSRRRGSSNLDSSSRSRRNPPSRGTSAEITSRGEEDLTPPADSSSLTEPQFFDWLSEVAMECKALTTKKTFGHSSTRSPLKRGGSPGRSFPRKAEPGHVVRGGRNKMESGGGGVASARRNAARAVVLLQWMEVSRGMRNKKSGDIPPFRLSSYVV